jgi:hypothetical protein
MLGERRFEEAFNSVMAGLTKLTGFIQRSAPEERFPARFS